MATAPLISAEVFDYLRQLGIEPYTKLDDSVRAHLGGGVRLVSLFPGETLATPVAGLRLTVLSGRVRAEPLGTHLDLAATRSRVVLTQAGDNRLVAVDNAVVLLADAAFLDTLSSWDELAAYARQSGGDDLVERLLAVRHTTAFSRVPLEHVIQALSQMTPRTVRAGEAVVTQGERGDAFYLLWSGRAEIWKAGIYDDRQKLVDSIGPGDSFGDEALVTGGTRNATVKMIEDGEVLVLGGQAFRELLSRPLIEEVVPDRVPLLINDAWQILDVRYGEEFEDGHIRGARHLPLPELRQRAEAELDKTGNYITVCLSGKRSAVAAFLLKQRGYNVVTMKDGMSCWEGETVS
jgi:rhodanese-related sulfurtransferase